MTNATRIPSMTILALLLALLTLGACAPGETARDGTRDAPTPIRDERRDQHVESFLYVWESVREKHWDPDLNGVDWEGAKDDLLPIVQNARTDAEARDAMNRLLGRLGQSHFGIIPGSAYERLERERRDETGDEPADEPGDENDPETDGEGRGWGGIDIRLVDGEFLITRVVEGSPADAARVQTGWIVEAIDGRETAPLVDAVREAGGIQRPETTAGLIVNGRVGGDVGETLTLTVIDAQNDRRDVDIVLEETPGQLTSFGNLPPTPLEIESRTLENGIGYFRFTLFLNPGRIMPAFAEFIKTHQQAPGIIIDMRGNPGGLIPIAPGIANWLIARRGLDMGKITMRDPDRGPFDIPLALFPRRGAYEGKVAVLTDEMSISNAEILSAGLKDIGRARLFGTRTAGLVLPSTVERLPNGDGFQYAFASYTTAGGYTLEGAGAVPDVEAGHTRKDLLAGRDNALVAATRWILRED